MNLTYRAASSLTKFLNCPDGEFLLVTKRDNCVLLEYDSPIQSSLTLERIWLPCARYQGELANTLLHFFEEQGFGEFITPESMMTVFDGKEIDAIERVVKDKATIMRRQRNLQLLLTSENGGEQSSEAASMATVPSCESFYNCPAQLMQLARQLINTMNDDVSINLEKTLKDNKDEEDSRRFYATLFRRAICYKSQKRNALINEIVNHTFVDGVKSTQVTEFHFRPFTFVGFWVSIPESVYAPVSADIAFYDTRRPGCINQMDIQEFFTNEVCLYSGWEHLQLNPSLRSWCEKSGQPHPTQKGFRLISAAEIEWEFGG